MSDTWNTRTKLVHEGSRRSQYGEMAEAIFLTQGFVYPSAEAAEARLRNKADEVRGQAEAYYEQARVRGREYYDDAAERFDEAQRYLVERVQERPMQSTGIALGIGVVIGGPYNSGVLATGARPGAFYDYDPAPKWVLDRVAQIEAVCNRHAVRLVDAAFQFPLRHKAVVSVIPGGQGLTEMNSNIAASHAVIPAAFWAELKSEGLLRPHAPVNA